MLIYFKYYIEQEYRFEYQFLDAKYLRECSGDSIYKIIDELLTQHGLTSKLMYV